MQVSITGKKIEVGESLRAHTEEKVRSLVEKYDLAPLEASAVFHKDARHRSGDLVRCDIEVHLDRHVYVRAHADAEDPYVCVDAALETLEGRIRRHKNKISALNRKRDMDAAPAQQYIIESGHDAAHEDAPLVIAETKTHIPTLTVAEAVMHLDLSDATALLFQNDAHGRLNVVYRRPDGNIGWIAPSQDAGA